MSKSYFSHPASVLKTHDTFHGVKHSYKKILKKVKKSPPLPTKTTNKQKTNQKTPLIYPNVSNWESVGDRRL